MFGNLDVFQVASQMARHASMRQGVIARNVANANTPGFKSMDLETFRPDVRDRAAANRMNVTRDGHMSFGRGGASGLEIEDRSAVPSPNGNTVEIEAQILKSVDAERQHSRAMAVYQSSMSLLRTSIGRGR
ncbi:flagellar basal-body rod protein FlgB [Litoreibacter ponti]|uniref:Flagellar basal-body rod protein FlgB n=1 Tax=Litoreibacter ponti TaxID=1510457 RepID=A0A2T6BNB7_9RHOB|nr:flagellar basal-body rod protein FlgB [Litoreibacter ponti]